MLPRHRIGWGYRACTRGATHNAVMEISGIATYAQLRGSGASRRDINDALATGVIRRLMRGWYEFRDADPDVARALELKGRLGCLSGCASYGLWVPAVYALHVVYGDGARYPHLPGLFQHVSSAPHPRTPVWPLKDCLAQVAQRHSAEEALVVLESALNLRLIKPDEIHEVLGHPTRSRIRLAKHLDVSESGSETRVRLFLRRCRVPVRPQVNIRPIGRVDLLVGERLIIECDGAAFHRSAEQHEIDRSRDLAARDLGLDTLRLSYRQIWDQWPETQASLLRQIRRRKHINRSR